MLLQIIYVTKIKVRIKTIKRNISAVVHKQLVSAETIFVYICISTLKTKRRDFCSSLKEEEKKSKQMWERTSKFPPFNCKGNKIQV